MAPQILCCCEIRGAVIDEWLFLARPYCQLSKFGKMYQIYRLKSQNTYQEIVLLDAETIEATWSFYYCNFNCNCWRSNPSYRNRIICYWTAYWNKFSFRSIWCHIVSNWCCISRHGLWIREGKGMGMDYTTIVLIIGIVVSIISLPRSFAGGFSNTGSNLSGDIVSIAISAFIVYYLDRPNVKAYFGRTMF